MLVLVACLFAAAAPALVGRSLRPLAELQLRGAGLVWLALLAQIVVVYGPLHPLAAAVLHVLTYLVAGVVLWRNRHLVGVRLVGAGAVLNGGTILLNGGTLPAAPAALDAAGLPAEPGFTNSGAVEHPVLPWLGDVFAWPEPLPLANVFSVGDVLIVLGVGWVAAQVTGGRAARAHHGPARPGLPAGSPAVPPSPR